MGPAAKRSSWWRRGRSRRPVEAPSALEAAVESACGIERELLELADQLRLVGDEADAFLAGDLARFTIRAKRPVASWMVLNRMAHAHRKHLAETVAEGRGWCHDQLGRFWQSEEQQLALRLVEVFSDPDDLRAFQLGVLVPLELELAADPRTRSAHEVMQLATYVVEINLAVLHRD